MCKWVTYPYSNSVAIRVQVLKAGIPFLKSGIYPKLSLHFCKLQSHVAGPFVDCSVGNWQMSQICASALIPLTSFLADTGAVITRNMEIFYCRVET